LRFIHGVFGVAATLSGFVATALVVAGTTFGFVQIVFGVAGTRLGFVGTTFGVVGTVLGFTGATFGPVRILFGAYFIQVGVVVIGSGFVAAACRNLPYTVVPPTKAAADAICRKLLP
jgi:hypothetical protein